MRRKDFGSIFSVTARAQVVALLNQEAVSLRISAEKPPMEDPQATSSVPPPTSAASGLADNVAGALAYVTVIPAIVFLVMDEYNKRPFVRFNAFQCLCLAATWIVLSFVCGIIPILGWFVLLPIVALTMLVTVIMCIVKAYSGVKFKVPLIGNYAEKFAQQ